VIPLGHVGGMPLEELLPALAGPSAGLLAVRAWIATHRRRERRR
jgi:hypothetical protein